MPTAGDCSPQELAQGAGERGTGRSGVPAALLREGVARLHQINRRLEPPSATGPAARPAARPAPRPGPSVFTRRSACFLLKPGRGQRRANATTPASGTITDGTSPSAYGRPAPMASLGLPEGPRPLIKAAGKGSARVGRGLARGPHLPQCQIPWQLAASGKGGKGS
jgi:hypothetical protein